MRRRFQEGHVFQRGKRRKVWVARYLEPTLQQGKIRSVLRSRVIGPCGEMSRSTARTVLKGWLRPLNEGIYSPIESASFDTFLEKWECDLLPTYRESTRKFYQQTARRWIRPYFSHLKMAEIRPAEVQKYINIFAGRYSRSVLKHLRATLRCLFATAVGWRYLAENPVERLKLPSGRPVRRATVLKPEQIAMLLARLGEPYRTILMLAATSGLRETELFGLQWEDFDFSLNLLHVRRRVYRRRVGETKTAQSLRDIPLHPEVAQAVRSLPKGTTAFIFAGPKGGFPRADEVLHESILPVARELGLPDFTWRNFRRSAESAMHNGGVPLKVQQQMLGHANPNTTLLYAEADEVGKRRAVDDLRRLIFPKFSQVARVDATSTVN